MPKLNAWLECTGNSTRSQMAVVIPRPFSLDAHGAYSAGTKPKGLNLSPSK